MQAGHFWVEEDVRGRLLAMLEVPLLQVRKVLQRQAVPLVVALDAEDGAGLNRVGMRSQRCAPMTSIFSWVCA